MLAEEGIENDRVSGYGVEVNTHFSVANNIFSGKADVGVATESVALYYHLHFTKLFEERFDMVIHKDSFFDQNVQTFIEFIRSDAFAELIVNIKGYSNRETGRVLYPKNPFEQPLRGDSQ
jgi:putative molybdopterin biosynthesis protein